MVFVTLRSLCNSNFCNKNGGYVSLGFQCKQFYVQHDNCAMKVTTDSLMLGSWVQIPNKHLVEGDTVTELQILDIGTGTGLLALMLAQRTVECSANIDAIEIDPAASQQAFVNTKRSPWQNRIHVIHGDVKYWFTEQDKKYDLIISNPPYFQSDLLSTHLNKQIARHSVALTLTDLFNVATDQLHPRGVFALVLPENILAKCLDIAEEYEFVLRHVCKVKPTVRKNTKLVLLSFDKQYDDTSGCVQSELIIHSVDGCYSDAYKQLTRDFYLSF